MEDNGGVVSELSAFLSISDDDFLPQELHDIKEEMVEEVMQELLKEINGCSNGIDDKRGEDSSIAPASTPAVVVPGGSKESCGVTYSDSASTVMAGIDLSNGASKGTGGGAGSSSSVAVAEAARLVGTTEVFAGVEVVVLQSANGIGPWVAVESESTSDQRCMQGVGGGGMEKMDGCDGMEVDDEWLARVLCSGTLELEEWL